MATLAAGVAHLCDECRLRFLWKIDEVDFMYKPARQPDLEGHVHISTLGDRSGKVY